MCDSGTNDKKIICYKVERPDYPGTFCMFKDSGSLLDAELDPGEVGDSIVVTIVKMTEDEFEDLGEFEGW